MLQNSVIQFQLWSCSKKTFNVQYPPSKMVCLWVPQSYLTAAALCTLPKASSGSKIYLKSESRWWYVTVCVCLNRCINSHSFSPWHKYNHNGTEERYQCFFPILPNLSEVGSLNTLFLCFRVADTLTMLQTRLCPNWLKWWKRRTRLEWLSNLSRYIQIISKPHKTQRLWLSDWPGWTLCVQVKNHMWLFVNCLIENPSFDSQTKENMTLQQKSFGSTCSLSDKFIKQVRNVTH